MHKNGWLAPPDRGIFNGPPYKVGSSLENVPSKGVTRSNSQLVDRDSFTSHVSETSWDTVIGQMERPGLRHSHLRDSGRQVVGHSNGHMMNGDSVSPPGGGPSIPMEPVARRLLDRRTSGFAVWTSTDTGQKTADVRRTAALRDPALWQRFQHLAELNIEDEDGALKAIPPEIGNLAHLRKLTIRWGRIKNLPSTITQLSLTHVNISQNRMQSVDGIETVSTLVVLDIACNALVSLPKSISQWKSLKYFNASGNKLKNLPDDIGGLAKLEELNVGSNKLPALPDSMCKLGRLKILDVSMNQLTKFPEGIGNLTRLIELRASSNRIGGLPQSIQNCRELRHLLMRRNRIPEVPSCLQPLRHLETINLCENQVKGMASPLSGIRHLLLNTNRLQVVPPPVLDCPTLEVLAIEDNEIKELPREVAKLAKLRALYVSHNGIEEIPNELCHLTHLRHLTLARTRVRTLPRDFDALHRLSHLNLNQTDIDGELNTVYLRGVEHVLEYSRSKRETRQYETQEESTMIGLANGREENFEEIK